MPSEIRAILSKREKFIAGKKIDKARGPLFCSKGWRKKKRMRGPVHRKGPQQKIPMTTNSSFAPFVATSVAGCPTIQAKNESLVSP